MNQEEWRKYKKTINWEDRVIRKQLFKTESRRSSLKIEGI